MSILMLLGYNAFNLFLCQQTEFELYLHYNPYTFIHAHYIVSFLHLQSKTS
jgi:hypothetical protein